MPISLPQSYDNLLKLNVKGNPLGYDVVCCLCGEAKSLFFTGRAVERGSVWLDENSQAVSITIHVPIAKCLACGGHSRVLSYEIFPYKAYTLAVIERCIDIYTAANSELGLRKTAEKIGGKAQPDHSTIWHWLCGMGERLYDRAGNSVMRKPPPATSLLIEESARKISSAIRQLWLNNPEIPSWKYKSISRKEQLSACAKLLNTAKLLFSEASYPLLKWQQSLTSLFYVTQWSFFTQKKFMSIQHFNNSQVTAISFQAPEEEMVNINLEMGGQNSARSPPNSNVEV